jgi:hypothetical protein
MWSLDVDTELLVRSAREVLAALELQRSAS